VPFYLHPAAQTKTLCCLSEAERIDYLCRTYRDNIFRICCRFLHDPEDAEDAAQEVLLLAAKHLPQYRADCALMTWIGHIARNYCLSYLRARSAHATDKLAEETHSGESPISESEFDNILFCHQVEAIVLFRLSLCDRLIYTYHFHYEMNSNEIASALPATMHLSASGVRTRLCRVIRPTIQQVLSEME